jgi:hypothetical protein
MVILEFELGKDRSNDLRLALKWENNIRKQRAGIDYCYACSHVSAKRFA